jgi:hypothetical protein
LGGTLQYCCNTATDGCHGIADCRPNEARRVGHLPHSKRSPRSDKNKQVDECLANCLKCALAHQSAMAANTVFLRTCKPKVFLSLKPTLMPVSIAFDGGALCSEPTLMVGKVFFRAGQESTGSHCRILRGGE